MKLGVIVGRFQEPYLHIGHKKLIRDALQTCDELLVCIGSTGGARTDRCPLTYTERVGMVLEYWLSLNTSKQVFVAEVLDSHSDAWWSDQLDKLIDQRLTPDTEVILIGSRDSFWRYYHGKYQKYLEIPEVHNLSATSIRQNIQFQSEEHFRAGIIYAQTARFPVVYPTVDIAIFEDDKILLAQKNLDGNMWRLPGGHVDPNDLSLEMAARREAAEETGLEITGPYYVGSFKIPDYRYAKSKDGIITALFWAKRLFGRPAPKDDIQTLQSFPIASLPEIAPIHAPLVREAITAYKRS